MGMSMASASTTRRSTMDERQREQIRRLEKDRKEQQEVRLLQIHTPDVIIKNSYLFDILIICFLFRSFRYNALIYP